MKKNSILTLALGRWVFFSGMRLVLWGAVLTAIPAVGADLVTQPLRSFGLGELHTVAVSPDQTRLATAGQTGAFLWDLAKGEVLHRLEAHRTLVTALAFSPDGAVLATGDRNGLVRTWAVATGTPMRVLNGHSRDISSLAFSPDGTSLLSASQDNHARVWTLASGALRQSFRVPGVFMNAAVFTPDAAQIITADTSFTNNVGLWDIATGARVRSFGLHVGAVRALAMLPNGHLATGGEDQTVRLWDILNGSLVRTLGSATSGIAGLQARVNSNVLVGGCFDGRVLAWETTTGALIHNLKRDSLIALAASPNANPVALATSDQRVEWIDLATSEVRSTLSGHTTSTFTGVAFSPDEQFVLAGGVEALTRLWNRTNAQPVRSFPGQGAGTASATFSADGTQVLTTLGFPRFAAQLWTVASGALQRELIGHTDWLTAARFSANGSLVVTASLDRSVRLWNAETGANLRRFTGSTGPYYAAAISPGRNLVAGGGGAFDPSVHVWNVQTGQLLHSFVEDAGTVRALDFTPSGDALLVGWEGGLVRVFDLTNKNILLEFVVPSGFLSAAVFSPDGQFILTGDNFPEFTARLWDARTGEMLRVFAGHTGAVTAVAFNPRGNLVLTGGDNVRLWSISDLGSRLQTTRGPAGLELRWSRGTLQRSPTLVGPWTAVTQAQSPWTVHINDAAEFFRVAVSELE